MRICIISPNRGAYSETFIEAHINGLDEVVGVLYGGHLPTHIQKNDEPLFGGGRAHRIKRLFAQKVFGQSLKDLQSNAIENYLKANNVELILAEYGQTGVEMLDIAKRNKIPLVVHFHGVDAYHHDVMKEYGKQYRELLGQVAAVVCVSRHMERRLLELGASQERLHYNPCGANTARFDGGDPLNAKVTFVGIGRFTEKKAPYLTILAFQKALNDVPSAKLILIGDGPLLDPCRKIVKALGLDDRVDLPGMLPPDKVAGHLKSARAFVQHSLVPANNDHEGTPVAVVEASATGVPVISTAHAGINDVVEHGKTGLLCAEGDILQMAQYMVQLGKDPAFAATLGIAGQEKVRKNFSLEISLSTLQAVLDKAMQEVQ